MTTAQTPRTHPVWQRVRVGPIARLSMGVVALMITLVMVADLMFGVLPSVQHTQRLQRQRVAETLAMQLTPLLELGDTQIIGQTLVQMLARDSDIRGITVRRLDGSVHVQRGAALASPTAGSPGPADGNAQTNPLTNAQAATSELRVAILAGKQAWGDVTLRFVSVPALSPQLWLSQPIVQLLLVLGTAGFVLCYAYLRRAMQYLNPSASVPDRVRKTFDALAEGLVIVDQQSRIVLANRGFRRLHPDANVDLNGQRLDALPWLLAAADGPAAWARTLQSGVAVQAQPLSVPQPDGPPAQLLVSAAAVTDDKGRARGCLVTFDDVTAVHRANEELRHTLSQLENSRQRIEEQNEELRRLASRDALTGCFNRRAFFELASELFAQAQQSRTPLCCLMIDIDHFKQFNDSYGHAVGDQVIQVVSRALTAGLRQADVLGRYGGEEFCVVLPGLSVADALAVAERMRADIQANAHLAIRGTKVNAITASFGVATFNVQARSIEALIDQADQALYRSKQSGRNRVTPWLSAVALLAEKNTGLLAVGEQALTG
jgi:diguanylate cyclase (GGDEF)-like protein/PAS domain S-box-containing protein